MSENLNLFKYYNMDKNDFVKIVKEKYHVEGKECYKCNAMRINPDGTHQVMQGYVVDGYFIEAKTLQVFNKSYFNMINNIEDNENI
ncbi:MAG: hypothetical protein IJ099_07105 [Alphaproteobacteria bacterium]|nr:hypothetical protein [Alphaproteobacteria bacterium]